MRSLLAIFALLASMVVAAAPAQAAVGLRVEGRNIVESDGNVFVIRGTSHPHAWYASQTSSIANIKSLGANAVRVVLSGGRWTTNTAADVANIVSLCEANRLVCILENHDTTGYGEQSGAVTLDAAANYWIGIQSALTGHEDSVIINIGNEPVGNNAVTPNWTQATSAAIVKLRNAGFQHLLMVDAPNWGQDWQFQMRDNAATVAAADPQDNTVFSVHMYGVFDTAAEINAYLDAFEDNGLPLVIGEFGFNHSDGNPDEDTIMAQAQARGVGYLGWSWSGNGGGVEYLDQVVNFNPAQLTSWGVRLFQGTNGIASTAEECSQCGGGAPPVDTTPPTTPANLAASGTTSNSTNLSWSASTDNVAVTGYEILRGGTQVGTSTTTSFAATGLTPSTAYQFQVRARDAAGNRSGLSTAVNVTTQAGPVGGCTATASVQSQWGGGYVMQVTVKNTGTSTITGWGVAFALPSGHSLSNIWNATYSGGVARNMPYNGTLAPNASTSFGFQATRPGGDNAVPTTFTCS
ncbi:cellulase family glycosylhydrolase [Nonomuraea soli]|uniref:Endoglucanase n=1 Tax=Nonomuraea soli TaxID=1032476 RepID=A0A7W0HQ41_9ACTN|nr:cellulase family glycosylhydrolase [Nonomuraea soli]MBA2891518.1 mannan endo-1,4-beta-mannosidase [Nonomuraea soli]